MFADVGISSYTSHADLNRLPRPTPPSHATAADAFPFLFPSAHPIQQLTGQLSSHDSQYQCGQPLLQFGIVAATPITSPTMKNHNTCRPALPGANRAHTHAHTIEITTNSAVLAASAAFDGTRPLTKSPGNIRDSSGSVPSTSTIDNT